ncbi:tail terminator [Achromobacter phage 83-24]|uniref:Tail protein n=1 Tax=Achromobacter phage 83-24 TaxID=1589747 RepID=A0A0B4ZZG5_9CAUD|nr:tail terminator [Achromobacter phage 83-24]AJD82847.1 hypothetical protein JWAP_00014 [Achromobacter phage 83-24]
MPITSTAEARNIMNNMAYEGIVAGAIQFVGDEKLTVPEGNIDWCRVQITHVVGNQETLANFNGVRRYNRTGTIIVQCFAPLSDRGFSRAEALAEQAVKVYEGKAGAGGIWFRNVRSVEVGAADGWHQFNAIAEFDYSIKR